MIKTKRKSLREIARSLEKTSVSPSPNDLATRILAAIDPADYKEYLAEALAILAVTYKVDFRRESFKNVVATSRGQGKPSRVKVPAQRTQIVLDPITGEETREETPEYKKAKSFKNQMIKSEWEEYLERNLPTGDEKRPYILIKDATVADLRRAAEFRRQLASANEDQAKKYDALADTMVLKRAATLGLLTADDVKGML